MKSITKAEAFEALEHIMDGLEYRVKAKDIVVLTRFIEQQWDTESETLGFCLDGDNVTEIKMKGEGTI